MSGACFALLALSGIQSLLQREMGEAVACQRRERGMPSPGSDIFVFRSKRMVFLLSLLSLIFLAEREREIRYLQGKKNAVRHSVNAVSWAPCFHKTLVLSIYFSCVLEG